MSKPFKLSFIVGLVVLGLGIIAIQVWHNSTDKLSSSARNALYTELLEMSGQLNRDLPRLLDRNTRFERAEAANYGMRFYYSLIKIDRYSHDIEDIQAQIEPQMLAAYCQGDALAFYREQADFVEFQYLDQSGQKLFRLRYTPEACAPASM